jgi:hypothetical protein
MPIIILKNNFYFVYFFFRVKLISLKLLCLSIKQVISAAFNLVLNALYRKKQTKAARRCINKTSLLKFKFRISNSCFIRHKKLVLNEQHPLRGLVLIVGFILKNFLNYF